MRFTEYQAEKFYGEDIHMHTLSKIIVYCFTCLFTCLFICLALWTDALAIPITSEDFSGASKWSFNYKLKAGSLDSNEDTYEKTYSDQWGLYIKVMADNWLDDQLWIEGYAVHLFGPCGETKGTQFDFNKSIFEVDDAGDFTVGTHTKSQHFEVSHVSCTDIFDASLKFNVIYDTTGINHYDINWFEFTVTGNHVVPEPSTYLLLLLGLVGMVGIKKKALADK